MNRSKRSNRAARAALAACVFLAATMAMQASAKAPPARGGQQSKGAPQQNKNSVLPSNVRR